METRSLTHKVVVVTGAGGRLGQAILQRFAREGARLAAVVRTADQARQFQLPEGAEGAVFHAELADEAQVAACFGKIWDSFGYVDVLVHAAGLWAERPFLEMTLDDWRALLDANLTSTFLCFREAARLMRGRPNGRLIAFASMQGADRGRARQAAYSAAKGGLVRLVEAIGSELAAQGITAHVIAPSVIRYDGQEGTSGVEADKLAELCVYLCSAAGAALNGTVLRAYGRGF
ncbi:SDR family NAD(P)-dependent oxidoreductase [Rhodothermus profundi]|uniref:3-oxoacyl-[acyl-carrier protein] reductase n=1 Tax=Rhodothermus profundi TaxID=633813 RepID=A0A1M6UR00_9BACT|nr:SDR family NAD(P)-dependent oxidoreductase [Rhodothermus profundi]SHK71600.1 3-oxoacyl-[acyl-carrier protein] reductase [Rhodothermus profundi]